MRPQPGSVRGALYPDVRSGRLPPPQMLLRTRRSLVRLRAKRYGEASTKLEERGRGEGSQRLNEVLAGMAEAARVLRERREEAERRQREWEEQRRQDEEARQEAELAHARHRKLADLSRQWQERERIQRYLEAVRERMKVARAELIPTAEAWIDWAQAHLDEHRPAAVVFFDKLIERDATSGTTRWTANATDTSSGSLPPSTYALVWYRGSAPRLNPLSPAA